MNKPKKSKLRCFILLMLIVLLTVALCSCSKKEDAEKGSETDATLLDYMDGYSEGYDTGYYEGYTKGVQDVYNQLTEAGYGSIADDLKKIQE